MADPGFEAFLWSLTQQESGGNYGAVGVWVDGDRAYGRYQVMGANVGDWTAKHYGRRLTPQQFLGNKAAQDAVVRGVLGGYYKKYGARGAAAMWYSGQPNPNKTYGNPPVYKYVNSVMNRASTYSGQGFGYSGGGGGTGSVTPKLDRAELAEQYGLSSALINSSGELRSLFEKAVAGSWSASRFQASLKNTKWWKNQPDSLRKYITLRFTDPATWKQQRTQALISMNQLAVKLGLGDQINRNTGKASQLLVSAAYYSQALGWTEAQLRDWMGSRVTLHGNIMYGEAGDAWDKLHEIAYLNGMQYSQDWYKGRAVAIVAGRGTLSTYEDQIRQAAAARYSAFAEQIKAGQNVMDLAAPYIKSAAQLLELPETDVDLFNPHIAKAMTTKQPGEKGGAMSLWQFENDVRNDPLWRKTNNARESMMSVARQVAKDFGLAY